MTTVILRFRDVYNQTPGHTVDQHNSIVQQSGSCWWGWWKKQNEPVPLELLSKLKQLAASTRLEVYLLDSGRRQIHKAQLLDVYVDVGKEPVSSPDSGVFTPEYYRINKYPAWFKLAKIEPCAEAQLNELIYDGLVHDDVVAGADQLLNTRIASIRELLQFGNVTYWVAATAKAGTPITRERLLPQRIPPAIAPRDIVLCENPWILHLSDIHCSREKHFYKIDDSDAQNTSLATEIFRALQRYKSTIEGLPGLVVVSGDLTWTGSKEEFQLATRVLEDLRSALGISRRHFVVIPGNHDIQWAASDGSAEYEWTRSVAVAPDVATKNYREFFSDWYKTIANPSLSIGTRFFCFGGPTVDVLGLNSSELTQTPGGFAGMGRITDTAFETSLSEFGWREKLRAAQFRILVVHHHVRPVIWTERPGDARRGFGVAIDAAAVVRRSQEGGVDLLLHGHQHQPYLGVANDTVVMAESQNIRSLLVAGAGSCGVVDHDLGPVRQRSFQLLRVHSNGEVEVLLFTQSSDARRFELTWRYRGSEKGWTQSPTPRSDGQ